MKLRTITGTRWPAICADGCGTRIPPGETVKVVVDFDSRPRKTWIPTHSPDAGTWKGNGGNGHAEPAPGPTNGGSGGFAPASQLPVAPPRAPDPPAPPKTPAPSSLALLGAAGASEPSPSASAGAAWATSQLTFNAGPYESVKSGFADYCRPGESEAQLRERVNAVVLADVEFHVRAIRDLHARLGVPGQTFARTSSPAASAGAPQGALATPFELASHSSPLSEPSVPRSSPPRMITPSASPAVEVRTNLGGSSSLGSWGPEQASPGLRPSAVDVGRGPDAIPARGDPTVADLVARIQFELTDQGVKRSLAKKSAVGKLLELRGLRSLRECGPSDERALRALLENFEQIDSWDLHDGHGQAPRLDERLVLPA